RHSSPVLTSATAPERHVFNWLQAGKNWLVWGWSRRGHFELQTGFQQHPLGRMLAPKCANESFEPDNPRRTSPHPTTVVFKDCPCEPRSQWQPGRENA